MSRILSFFLILAILAIGLAWVADQPGSLSLIYADTRYEVSLLLGILFIALLLFMGLMIWSCLRFLLNLPSVLAFSHRMRRQERAFKALSRGILAASAGDVEAAQRHAKEAGKLLPEEPLSLLLRAQAAQLSGDRLGAEELFSQMTDRPDMRLLGLRGLHVEARRRNDMELANHYACQAHERAPLAWAGQAVLEYYASQGDWDRALEALERSLQQEIVDPKIAHRQKAVIETARALACANQDADLALDLARDALKMAPDLVPAAVLAARLLKEREEPKSASRIIKACWRLNRHPDLAHAYVDIQRDSSAKERLGWAEKLAAMDPTDPESCMIVAKTALEAREFERAREVMAPMVHQGTRPSRRVCLMMAKLEMESRHHEGAAREWLTRAAFAPRDPAWVAEGIVRYTWLPAHPETGRLDAFVWKVPDEEIRDAFSPMAENTESQLEEKGLVASVRLASPPVLSLPSEDTEEEKDFALGEEKEIPEEGKATEGVAKEQSFRKRARKLISSSAPSILPVEFPQPAPPDDPGPKRKE